MLASESANPELRRSARLTDEAWQSRIERWTDDRPDPARWLDTLDLQRARREVEEALRAGSRPIVISGPSGHGKTLLLRSLRSRPPHGFAPPLFVPFANVEPDELAGWMLEVGNRGPVRDPAAGLARLLRANVSHGARTLLLIDEVQLMPCATLSKLFEIVARAAVEVSVVLAGLAGEELDLALGALRRPIRRIPVAAPWSRADAELLLTRVALSLGITPSQLIAEVDVDAALSAGAGNPRLVRAALAARLGIAELLPVSTVPVAPLATPEPSGTLAACSTLVLSARNRVEAAIAHGRRADRRTFRRPGTVHARDVETRRRTQCAPRPLSTAGTVRRRIFASTSRLRVRM